MKYRIIDVSGDVGIRAEGSSLEECFINSALGLYSLITDIDSVEPAEEKEINLREDNLETLLVSFLNELIFQFDTYGFIGKLLSLDIQEGVIFAKIKGEKFNPEKHERKLLIKAATYHNLVLKKEDSLWIAEIIFDI
ncbi:MAG: archease [Thermodesulfovibrio sp.]|nr:archease [Thermodesulfovibrio sp.]